jgi:hypothetical protein
MKLKVASNLQKRILRKTFSPIFETLIGTMISRHDTLSTLSYLDDLTHLQIPCGNFNLTKL